MPAAATRPTRCREAPSDGQYECQLRTLLLRTIPACLTHFRSLRQSSNAARMAHSKSPPTTAASSNWSNGRTAPLSTGMTPIASRAGRSRTCCRVSSTAATPSASSISRDGDGVSAQFYRIKLAPLPKRNGSDATLPAQRRRPHGRVASRANASRRNAARQSHRPSQPARFQRSDRDRRAKRSRVILSMRCSSSTCCASAASTRSMGSLAGDELLITFARRLILALRAGDVLARTGGNEFGVLVSLRRGVEDALKAAERIQDVMTAPFKLSRARNPRRMRDRRRADACRTGSRRAVPQRAVRGEAGQDRRPPAGLRAEAGDRGPAPLLDRDRTSPGARQGPAQAILPTADQPEERARLRASRRSPAGPTRIAARSVRPNSSRRRGIRPDPPARPLGDGQGGANACRLGPQGRRDAAALRRRQPVRHSGRSRRHCSRRRERPEIEWADRRSADARADGKLDRPGPGRGRRGCSMP